jgi:glucokinase
VCTLGIPRQNGVDLAPNIAGWERIEFGTQLRAAFPDAVVRMGNDVKVAAQAELDRGALAGCDTGVYLNLGTGLAAAIVVGGRVVHGAHGAAGEIGYNLRQPFDHHDTTRLEDVVSGRALELASGELFGAADVAALFDRASKERRARRLCEQFVAELTYHVANLAVAVDPERVVVGGGLMRAWEHLQPALAAALEAAVPFPPELVPAAHPFDAPLIGALAMASAAFRAAATDSRETVPEGAPA